MKITIDENDGNFWISLHAETVQESSLLCRMGMNWKRKISDLETWANQSGISTIIVLDKRMDTQSCVRRH